MALIPPPTDMNGRAFMGPVRQSEYWEDIHGRHAQEDALDKYYEACESASDNALSALIVTARKTKLGDSSGSSSKRKHTADSYGTIVKQQKLNRRLFDFEPEEESQSDKDLEAWRIEKHSVAANNPKFTRTTAPMPTPRKPGIFGRRAAREMDRMPGKYPDDDGFDTLSESSEADAGGTSAQSARGGGLNNNSTEAASKEPGSRFVREEIQAAETKAGPHTIFKTPEKPAIRETARSSPRLKAVRDILSGTTLSSPAGKASGRKLEQHKNRVPVTPRRSTRHSSLATRVTTEAVKTPATLRRSTRHRMMKDGEDKAEASLTNWNGEELEPIRGSAFVLGKSNEMTEEEMAACVFVPENGGAREYWRASAK